MTPSSIFACSALEQARLVRTRQISAEELARLYLDRIEAKNPALSAFVQVLTRAALREARSRDEMKDRELPFFGVPIGIKDLNFVKGSFTRFGSRAFKYLWSPIDDRMVAQLRRGGFVILGKLATSELGAMPVTEPLIHPPTRNPWNLDVTAGGSSGGSGAAVAAGLLPIAQGSDGAGSIRIPSSFCHLFGFKPSRGMVPDPYGRDGPRTLSVVGPLARSVDDAAAMLDVMTGASVPFAGGANGPRRKERFAELAIEKPPRLRVRLVIATSFTPTHPEVAGAVAHAARVLEGLGHSVEEYVPLEAELSEFLPLWQKLIASVPVPTGAFLSPVPRWLLRAGRALRLEDVQKQHDRLVERVRSWWGDTDIMLSPTVAAPPPNIGALDRTTPEETFGQAAALGAFTALFNVSGQPAASVPVGLTRDGLPIGLQIAGRSLEDARVLAVSRQLEEAMPWGGRAAPT